MEPSVIGPYILLGLGAAAVIAAIAGHFKKLAAKSAALDRARTRSGGGG